MSDNSRFGPTQVLNQTISSGPSVQSTAIQLGSTRSLAFGIVCGGTLSANFQLLMSVDGTNFFDSGTQIQGTGTSGGVTGVTVDCQAPYALIQVQWLSGSGNCTIKGFAKGV